MSGQGALLDEFPSALPYQEPSVGRIFFVMVKENDGCDEARHHAPKEGFTHTCPFYREKDKEDGAGTKHSCPGFGNHDGTRDKNDACPSGNTMP